MRHEPRDPGAVDQNVAAAELSLDLARGATERAAVRHVGGEGAVRPARELRRKRLGSFTRAPVADDDMEAGPGERMADRGADPARATRHDRNGRERSVAQDAPP